MKSENRIQEARGLHVSIMIVISTEIGAQHMTKHFVIVSLFSSF